MAKFHGILGYVKTEETSPGVHREVVTERVCTGDILRSSQAWNNTEHLNNDLTINNRFSIIADAFAFENFQYIHYIQWNGVKWSVSLIEIQRPRFIITIGKVYNG